VELNDVAKKEVIMLRVVVLTALLVVSGFPQSSRADIYVWTDENGVKHFTNYAPPEQAQLLMKTREFAYDEAKDRERMEADRLQVQQQQWGEIEEKQAMLAYEQQIAARRLAEANRRAEDTLRQAESLLEEARQISEDDAFWDRNHFLYVPRYPYNYWKTYPYYRKEHPDGNDDRRPKASHWTKRDNDRKFSSRYGFGRFDRSHVQSRYDRDNRTSVNERFRGDVSTRRDSSGYSRAGDRFDRPGFKGYRR
jgi:hypothetical protein